MLSRFAGNHGVRITDLNLTQVLRLVGCWWSMVLHMSVPAARRVVRVLTRLAGAVTVAAFLAACQDTSMHASMRAYAPIPSDVLALMQAKGTDAHQPILIRAYKKEAELEIWKMRADGGYVHLKTYPMCRWSGQLGPKTREGDRQVPEGFYTITPGQMNPNSAYYLSFNVGYPNSYDRVHGYTGGAIMVHGACSSAGCFSMTDEQIAEIYAIAREAFGGGQRAIQMQSLPFHMSPENLAKYRFDPNMKFWKELKEGSDQFEVSQRETKVGFCGRRYVFGAEGAPHDAGAECPPLQVDASLRSMVAEKQKRDETKVAELVASGIKPVRLIYADGGQNPDFANKVMELSRPDAVDAGPREIAVDEHGRPLPAAVQMTAARKPDAAKPMLASAGAPVQAAPTGPQTTSVAARSPEPDASAAQPDQPFYKRWVGGIGNLISGSPPNADLPPAPSETVAPQPARIPLPPRREARVPAETHASLAIPANMQAFAELNR